MNFRGEGIASSADPNRKTVRIANAIEGEIVWATEVPFDPDLPRHLQKNIAYLRSVETPSPRRVAPQCKHWQRCAMCQYACLEYEEQAKIKFDHWTKLISKFVDLSKLPNDIHLSTWLPKSMRRPFVVRRDRAHIWHRSTRRCPIRRTRRNGQVFAHTDDGVCHAYTRTQPLDRPSQTIHRAMRFRIRHEILVRSKRRHIERTRHRLCHARYRQKEPRGDSKTRAIHGAYRRCLHLPRTAAARLSRLSYRRIIWKFTLVCLRYRTSYGQRLVRSQRRLDSRQSTTCTSHSTNARRNER